MLIICSVMAERGRVRKLKFWRIVGGSRLDVSAEAATVLGMRYCDGLVHCNVKLSLDVLESEVAKALTRE